MSRERARQIGLLVAGLICCSPAWAHGGLSDGKSLWGGASHFLTSPLSLAALAGLAAALFGVTSRLSTASAIVAGLAAGISSALAAYVPAYTAPALVVAVGLVAVTGWKPSNLSALLLSVVAGTAGGIAADIDVPSWPGAIGVAGSMMLILGCALAASEDLAGIARLQAILPIARRVLGSWVAAIGLLMTTLAIHLGKK